MLPASAGENKSAPLPVLGAETRREVLAVCGLLLLAVGLVFGQTVRHGFVNMDDGEYVSENPHVLRGLSASGVAWVFSHSHSANWHPLTGLSHMLDAQIYGLRAGGHHLTNILLHATTAMLLFIVLRQLTGGLWCSAMVAALFAVHPLRVESVAWIAERKDVLSGLCFVLTLGAYGRFVRGPFSWGRYLLLLVIFALGLMAKPMLVTLPALLLLLDYWPLGRMSASPTPPHGNGEAFVGSANLRQTELGRFSLLWRLVLEKIPLLLLVALSCLMTIWAQGKVSAFGNYLTLSWRVANALVSYVTYLVQLFCPLGLAAYYPHPERHLPMWKILGALVILACISIAAVRWRRRFPYLLVGWLWYVGMLLPVIGIVQVGSQAMADRYTYLPQIGVYIALVFGLAEARWSWPYRRWLVWRGSGPGAGRSYGLRVAADGLLARQRDFVDPCLGLYFAQRRGRTQPGARLGRPGPPRFEAIEHYREALQFSRDYMEAHANLSAALIRAGTAGRGVSSLSKGPGNQAWQRHRPP